MQVADIFRSFGPTYRAEHTLSGRQQAVMADIEHCRTGYFGYHVDACEQCGYSDVGRNSCRNRHCPTCQGINRRRWVAARIKNLLPVPYYHVIFTLPHVINPLVPFNRELVYEMLFDAAAATLLQLGADPRWLGAKLGFYGILHSWGGKLWHHVHLHLLVAGGGTDPDGNWVEARHKGRFLLPIKVVSQVFRGKFVARLKRAWRQGELVLPDGLGQLKEAAHFDSWVNALVGRHWNVHIKAPFAGPAQVVRYIGRYSHKVAIDNRRLIKVADGRVQFRYKDYRHGGRWQQASLAAEEFIRRFLLHVLPKGFHRIRHFGFLANGCCHKMVKRIRAQLTDGQSRQPDRLQPSDSAIQCPQCAQGRLRPVVIVHRAGVICSLFFRPAPVAADTS